MFETIVCTPRRGIARRLAGHWIIVCLLVCPAALDGPLVNGLHAASRVTYSVTAVELFSALKARGIEPVLTTLYRDGRSRRRPEGAPAVCRFAANGLLEAVAQPAGGGSPADWCELELAAPGMALNPGWRVQRVHWTGDVREARFMHTPADSDRLDFRVALRVPSSPGARQSGERRLSAHRLRLQLVTLLGPDRGTWHDALSLPAKRQ